jgi:outer membrane immunogenic protein
MKKMKSYLAACASLALLSSSAIAADLPSRAKAPLAPILPVFSWTGFYVGVQAGGSWSEVKHSVAVIGPAFNSTSRPNGFVGGIHAGYNYQINQMVIGVEADVEIANGKARGTTLAGLAATSESRWQGSLRARLGYSFDRTLVYLTAGGAVRDGRYGYEVPGLVARFGETRFGWTVGAGVEHAFTNNWTARIEYRYADFGSASGSVLPLIGPPAVHKAKIVDHTVRLGVSYKF